MKKLSTILAVVLIAGAVMASDFNLAQRNSTLNLTNTVSLGTTNATPVTNLWRIESANYHTVVVNLTSTNTIVCTNSLSLDGNTWVTWFTNLGANTTITFATNLNAKWYWYRQICNGSNVSGSITYLGGQ